MIGHKQRLAAQNARTCVQAAVARAMTSRTATRLGAFGAERTAVAARQHRLQQPRVGVVSAYFAVHRLFSQKVEARVGEEYQKGQLDDSTDLVMEAPFGHDSNSELAEKLGIYKVYEYEDSGRVSRVTVAFQSRVGLPSEVQSVEAHMALDSANKLKLFPEGEVRGASLPDDVTTHFRDLKVPFAVEIFESNKEGVSDTLIFAFETPGGFWTIGWHVPVDLFQQEPDLFFLFLQALRLKPRDNA